MADQKDENLQTPPDPAVIPAEALRKQIEEQGQEEPQAEIQVQPGTGPVPEPAEEGTTEKKEEPPLIAGKFKTQEDLIQAYQEIEKMAHKSSQRASQYKEMMSPYVDFDEEGNIVGFKPQQQPDQQQPQGQTQQPDVWSQMEQRYQIYEQQYGPIKANLMLQAEIANAISQQQQLPIEELRASNSIEEQKRALRESDPDFTKFEKDIDKHLKRMDAKSRQNPKAVYTIYNMILGENYKKLLKEREQEVSSKTAEIEAQKQKAQVEHQTRPPEEPPVNIESLSASELASRMNLKKAERY
jgi:hypothetical protein